MMFAVMKSIQFAILLAVGFLALVQRNASADIVTFDNLTNFNNATGGSPFVVNFESSPLNTIIGNGTSFQGITFQYSTILPTNLVITNGVILPGSTALPTSSGTQFLGNTGNGQLLASLHDMTLRFSNTTAVGMTIIVDKSVGQPFAGDIFLSTTNGINQAILPATEIRTLSDGSREYFLGLQNTTGLLTDLSIKTDPSLIGTNFTYRIDDIRLITAVPEPGSLLLLGFTSLVAAIGFRRKQTINMGSSF